VLEGLPALVPACAKEHVCLKLILALGVPVGQPGDPLEYLFIAEAREVHGASASDSAA